MRIQTTRFRSLAFTVPALAVLVLGMNLRAEDSAAPRKKEAALGPKVNITQKVVAPRVVTSTTISEILAQNFTLAAGASQQFFAQSDFTGVDRVNLGFYASSDQDLSKTNYLVWWAMPGAPNYVVSDYIQGKSFPFLNSGGLSELSFGNQLLIEMRNNGDQPVTITQITAYAVAR